MNEYVAPSLGELERWEGGFPGEHEFSTLPELQQFQSNSTELDVFFAAAQKLTDDWKGNKFVGLYLYGTPGTGKTHAAVGLGRKLHDEIGAEVHYRFVPSLENSGRLDGPRAGFEPFKKHSSSVFPSEYTHGAQRNPRSVLILDDYKPAKQSLVARAIEEGAQFGGLVVITSNYKDPFKLLEPSEQGTAERSITEDIARFTGSEALAKLGQNHQARQQELSDSLRSRINAGFKFIEFSGPDYRAQNNFWD